MKFGRQRPPRSGGPGSRPPRLGDHAGERGDAERRRLAPARRWVVAYRTRLRPPLTEVPLQFLVLVLLAPAGCFWLAVTFLADGAWWQRLLAVPLVALGVVLGLLEFWFLQRPRRMHNRGWARSWFGPRGPGGA